MNKVEADNKNISNDYMKIKQR